MARPLRETQEGRDGSHPSLVSSVRINGTWISINIILNGLSPWNEIGNIELNDKVMPSNAFTSYSVDHDFLYPSSTWRSPTQTGKRPEHESSLMMLYTVRRLVGLLVGFLVGFLTGFTVGFLVGWSWSWSSSSWLWSWIVGFLVGFFTVLWANTKATRVKKRNVRNNMMRNLLRCRLVYLWAFVFSG